MAQYNQRWPPGTPDEVREYLARVILRCEGNLVRVAWQVGLASRQRLWEKLYQLRLWPVVNRARAERAAKRRQQKGIKV